VLTILGGLVSVLAANVLLNLPPKSDEPFRTFFVGLVTPLALVGLGAVVVSVVVGE
jgi:hypothetical protein